METFIFIADYVKWTLIIIISFYAFYLLFFSVAGLFKHKINLPAASAKKQIAVLVPGFKEDNVIFDSAQNSLNQDYGSEYYDLVIIADSFSPQTLQNLQTLPIKIIEVSFDISSKSKALNRAMEVLDKKYDIVVVLDADNLMEKRFLTKVNGAFEMGYIAVQCHRTAKNLNTPFAIMDAISEEINNHIFRKGHRVVGLSSALIGSGMAFEYQLFKDLMSKIDSFGEDKELELKLIEKKIKIEYLEDVYVYDEKTDIMKNLVRQRTRWISIQLSFAKNHFFKAFNQLLLKGNIDYFEKTVQHFQPPRILLGSFIFFIGVISLVFNFNAIKLDLIALFLMFVTSMLLSVPRKFMNISTLKITYLLPLGAILMLWSLINARKQVNSFNATEHSFISDPAENIIHKDIKNKK